MMELFIRCSNLDNSSKSNLDSIQKAIIKNC